MRTTSMTAEAITFSWIVKWIWILLVLPIINLFFKQHKSDKKIQSLEIKGENTKELLTENTKATKALTHVVTELRIDLAGRDSKARTRNSD